MTTATRPFLPLPIRGATAEDCRAAHRALVLAVMAVRDDIPSDVRRLAEQRTEAYDRHRSLGVMPERAMQLAYLAYPELDAPGRANLGNQPEVGNRSDDGLAKSVHCAWCGPRPEGGPPVSHGACEACAKKLLAEIGL